MDIDSVEREVADSIRDILKSRGVVESHIRIKAKTKTASAKIPSKAQGIGEGKEIVEWPETVVTMVKMKLTIEFVPEDGDSTVQ